MDWNTIERPGYFGKKRDDFNRQCNDKYGDANWRLMWQWNDNVISFITACQIYEDGYYADSFRRESLWKELASTASDVYDHQESNIKSGLDYLIQEGGATHLQDISIRRVMMRRGYRFTGDKLVQIRSHADYWGQNLSPGRVQFHLPEMIIAPHLEKWWDYNSIEDFWQSNKVLQVKG